MRSQRLQKVPLKKEATKGITVDDNLRFSKFEFMNVTLQDTTDGDFQTITEYIQSTSLTGLSEVQTFSEEIKYRRLQCFKEMKSEDTTNKKFEVDLAYEQVEDKYKCVRLVFSYTRDESTIKETAEIQVFAEDKPEPGMTGEDIKHYQLTVKDLDLDSDVTDYLFRFTKGLTWGSETYAILDCNPNLAINKGIYLTLNVPFESNIAWGSNKRKLIIAYRFLESN